MGVGTHVIPLCPALPSPTFTYIHIWLQSVGFSKVPAEWLFFRHSQPHYLLACPPLPTPHGHHQPSVTFIPPVRQPRHLLTEKRVLTQHGACHTRTTAHVSVLKTRLCLLWGQGWSHSFLITQSLEHRWFVIGTHTCLSSEWVACTVWWVWNLMPLWFTLWCSITEGCPVIHSTDLLCHTSIVFIIDQFSKLSPRTFGINVSWKRISGVN